jgi:phosphoserine phosphatase
VGSEVFKEWKSKKVMEIVAFDMDGTLISESSWELLHLHFKADPEKVQINKDMYFSFTIDYETWMEKDIALWNTPSIDEIFTGLSQYTLEPHVKDVVSALKEKQVVPCIVSSGISMLADMVGICIGIEPRFIFANDLIIDNGKLQGVCKVEPYQKDRIVKQVATNLGVPLEKVAAVGDAAPDISLFKESGLKIAYNPKDSQIVDAADFVITDLRELLNFFE